MKPLHTSVMSPMDLMEAIRAEQPARRENSKRQDYCEIRLERSARDCDGPMDYKPSELLITEEEIAFVLADHFGANGWTMEVSKPDEYFIWHCSRHDRTDEGYASYTATVYFPFEDIKAGAV
jgi:hypothetical protein